YKKTKKPRQVLLKKLAVPITFEDISGLSADRQAGFIEDFKKADREKGFNLSRGPLLRVALLKSSENSRTLVWSYHHILMDGWCFGIIFQDFMEIYDSLEKGNTPQIKPAVPYMRYINWLEKQDKQKALDYWKEAVAGCDRPARVPKRTGAHSHGKYKQATAKTIITPALTRALNKLAREKQTTLNTVFQTLWGILLQRFNNTDDVVFGSVVSGRPPDVPGISSMVGLFINTVPVRVCSKPGDTFSQLLETVGTVSNKARAFEYLPLSEIQNLSPLKNKLIDHILVFENFPVADSVRGGSKKSDLGFDVEDTDTFEQTGYDLDVTIVPGENRLDIQLTFNVSLYDEHFMQAHADRLSHIMRQVTTNPDIRIEGLAIITDREKHELLHVFNTIQKISLQNIPLKPLHQILKDQVTRSPEDTALVFGDQRISYSQLEKKSHALTSLLIEKGITVGSIAALSAERSAESLIAIWGILQAGAAYLPIDPALPPERKSYMLRDSNASALVAVQPRPYRPRHAEWEGPRHAEWEGPNVYSGPTWWGKSLIKIFNGPFGARNWERILEYDAVEVDLDDLEMIDLQLVDVAVSDPAYVIYTSGTTGRPKGVLVEHGNVVAYVDAFLNEFDVTETDVMLQQASYSFDAFVEEFYPVLLKGGQVVAAAMEQIQDVRLLAELIVEHDITIISCSPLLLSQLNDLELQAPKLRIVISGGDILKREYITNLAKEADVFNTYGPTETTVCATYHKYENKEAATIPIGRPIRGYTVHILDKNHELLPKGLPGEICISGPGTTRGYLNNPELTAQKFVTCITQNTTTSSQRKQHTSQVETALQVKNFGKSKTPSHGAGVPFSKGAPAPRDGVLAYPCPRGGPAGGIFYRSGDLGRWTADGRLEFLGRIDSQVKVRGYRIELGEIENRLIKCHGIRRAVVVDKIDGMGEVVLYAYVVCETRKIDINALRNKLTESLPEYMIPAFFVTMDELPLTASGKINKTLLPEPAKNTSALITPRNQVEKQLASIWSEVLGLNLATFGIDQNFFLMGGHSLRAARLTSNIHKTFDIKIRLAQVFNTPTIRQLAETIRFSSKTHFETIEPTEKKEYYPQSSAQKRLFLLSGFEKIGTSYNMPAVFEIRGKLDETQLAFTCRSLIRKHETLRTSFAMINGLPVQRVHETVDFAVEYYADEAEPETRFVRPFDLSQAPLLRVGIVRLEEGAGLLLFDMHHIISDGTSMEVLTSEFARTYAGESTEMPRIQYRDFSQWQDYLSESGQLERQQTYWRGRFTDVHQLPRVDLPADFPRPEILSFDGAQFDFKLEAENTAALRSLGASHGATLYMNVLTAFSILLHKYTGLEDILVGCGIAGRSHADLQHIIGLFVNLLVMRNFPAPKKSYAQFLPEVKKTGIEAFENQDTQFEELVDILAPLRDSSRNPLFDVSLVVQNYQSSGKKPDTGFALVPRQLEKNTAKLDMTLFVYEREDEIHFSIEYCTALFKAETVARISGHLLAVLQQGCGNPDILTEKIDIIGEREKVMLLDEFNQTAVEYPVETTIHGLFAQQVERTPDKPALAFEGKSLTYRQLNRASNRLARYLSTKEGIGPDQRVAVLMAASLQRIMVVMAILKAGGAFVPIDPALPAERIKTIITDCGASVVFSENRFLVMLNRLQEECDESISFIRVDGNIGSEAGDDNIDLPHVEPGNLAYIIYTSGTTGRPKGVMIEHRSLVNLSFWHNDYYAVTERDNTTQYAGFGFDVSVWEVFPYLICGACVHIISERIKLDIGQLNAYYETNGITMAWLPTQLCEQFLERENHSLRVLMTGGDKLRTFIKRDYDFYNNYGPTEVTVSATACRVDRAAKNIPIGRPLANTRITIVNPVTLAIQPIGVAGELCISGTGLARGYLDSPELTAEKFINLPLPSQGKPHTSQNETVLQDKSLGKSKDPFSKGAPAPRGGVLAPGGSPEAVRTYRSGDLARWLDSGKIEFLGRIDFQVKIRGFRIELGEIENQLLLLQEVKENIVIAKKDAGGEQYLCAYFVPAQPAQFDDAAAVDELRKKLSLRLPAYMVPTHFVPLATLPLSPNGKVDKKALPEPGPVPVDSYVAPRNKTEDTLARIWAEILHLDKDTIGIDADFFQMGGHSLKATLLVTEVQKQLGARIGLVEFFQFPTIRCLAQTVETKAETVSPHPDTHIIQLRRGTDKEKHLFFVHDGTGEVEGYLELCRHLDKSFNCWGIKAHSLINCAPRNVTIPELAGSYLPALGNIQPHGPYNIIGWSLGGIHAYEMARQLQQTGEKTGFLAIVDSVFPGEKIGNRDWNLAEFSVESELERLREYFPEIESVDGLKKAPDLETLWLLVMEYLERRFDTGQIRQLLATEMVRGLPDYDSLNGEQLVYYFNILRTLKRAVSGYQPQGKVDTPMVYVAAGDSDGTGKERWTNYCVKPVEYITIPGDHFSIFQQPGVRELAEVLNRVLSGPNRI
ncbi:MAG: amino acid adenylation domain-containing protein, partial [bacterium]|nr:amino acid adenylation domain-containing protein [bacterium]